MSLRSGIARVQSKVDAFLPPALFAGYLFFAVLMIVATAAAGLEQFPLPLPQMSRTKGFFWEIS
jgi:hypothetical protein